MLTQVARNDRANVQTGDRVTGRSGVTVMLSAVNLERFTNGPRNIKSGVNLTRHGAVSNSSLSSGVYLEKPRIV